MHRRLYPLPPTGTIFLNYLLRPEVTGGSTYRLSSSYRMVTVLAPHSCVGALLGICSGVDVALGSLGRMQNEEVSIMVEAKIVFIFTPFRAPTSGTQGPRLLLDVVQVWRSSARFSLRRANPLSFAALRSSKRESRKCFHFDVWQAEAAHGRLYWVHTETFSGSESL